MKYVIGVLASVLICAAASSAAAQTRLAEVTTNLNLRAGPDTHYPIVTTIPRGAEVSIFSCTSRYGWCDVGFSTRRGWVSADYLLFLEERRRRPVTVYRPVYPEPPVTVYRPWYPEPSVSPEKRPRRRDRVEGWNRGEYAPERLRRWPSTIR